jgi:hypothetical protein
VILIHDCDPSKKKRRWNIISYNIHYSRSSKGWYKKLIKSAITLYFDTTKCWMDQARKAAILEYEKSRKFKVIVFIIVCLW